MSDPPANIRRTGRLGVERSAATAVLRRHRRALLAGALILGTVGGGTLHLPAGSVPAAVASVSTALGPRSDLHVAQADIAEPAPKRLTRPEPVRPPPGEAPPSAEAPPAAAPPAAAAPPSSAPAERVEAPPSAPPAPGVAPPARLGQVFSFADVVERVRPAVVSIRARTAPDLPEEWAFETFPEVPEGHPLERFFRDRGEGRGHRPFGSGPRGRERERAPLQQSLGSGFIVSPEGRVVTNLHVVKGARDVTVVTDEGKEFPAQVIGRDDKTDIAVVQIRGEGLRFPTATFASADIRVGDWVLAVGNPFGLGGTVTAGIVSARGREIGAGPYDDFIQIDAPINRGNSGGPTFNLDGEVVGVNTAIFSPTGGSVGIGFAIPAATVQRVVAEISRGGEVVRGWLGVRIQPVTRETADGLGLSDLRGALVTEPDPGSPAERAGLRSGDAIIAVDGKPVATPRDLARRIADYAPGTVVRVTVVRRGRAQEIDVTLGRLPPGRT